MTPSDPTAVGPKRGAGLLLEHVLMRGESPRGNARKRLEETIGRELSTMLVSALTSCSRRRAPAD